MYMCVTELFCCTPKTNIFVQPYFNFKNRIMKTSNWIFPGQLQECSRFNTAYLFSIYHYKNKKMPCIWISRLVSKVLFKSCVCVSCSVVSNSLQPHGLYVNIYMNSPGKSTGMGCHFLLQGSSWLRNQTWVFCIEGRFFTIWVTREARWLLNLKGILKIWF